MRSVILSILFLSTLSLTALGQQIKRCDYKGNKNDKQSEQEFRGLHVQEADLVVKGDVAAWERFYPEDHIVTNPFNQLIDKKTVLERVKQNVIKYRSYQKQIEYLCVYDNAAVIAGIETAVAAEDANRPDAGKLAKRRFTETWIKRDKQWRKVARHVSTLETQ